MTKYINESQAWEILEKVSDPEIPVLTVVDLGIVRDVKCPETANPQITITPTYSGCPAMKVIEEDIRSAFKAEGIEDIEVKTVLHPPWTTDWLSDEGRKKLREYGIAPPEKGSTDKNKLFSEPKHIACPNCGSENTEMKSQFGSTPCKALYVCQDCKEPFDYFKCL